MSRAKSPGAGLFRLSLSGVICLSLATSIWAQDPKSQRIPHQPDPLQNPQSVPSSAKALPLVQPSPIPRNPLFEQRSPLTQHKVTTHEAPDPESDTPSELRSDPTPGLKGDLWSQQPIPDYLKGNPYRLSYIGGDYTPPVGERIDPDLYAYWQKNKGVVQKTYGFVMFQGKITAAKTRRVEALGVKLDNYHTFQSFSAVIPFKCIPALLGSMDVRWIGYAKPVQKIDPELAQKMAMLSENERSRTRAHLFVNVYESDLGSLSEFVQPWPLTEKSDSQTSVQPTRFMMSNGRFQEALEALGARVHAYHPDNKVFQIEAPYALVDKLAKLDWVHFIETIYPVEFDHDRSTRQVGVDRVRGSTTTDGSSTVVGVLDSGAYMGGGRHRDLNKNAIGWNFNGGLGKVFDEAHGHGTHVLGTIGGTGTADDRYKGCAPAIGGSGTTRIFIGKILGVSTTGTYPNNTLAAFTTFHKDAKVGTATTPYPHVVSNSWGYGYRSTLGYVGTDNISLAVDTQSYQYGQLYVFSGSNSGGSSTIQYYKSIRRPNVAKNALTVASNYDYRGTLGTKTFEAGFPSFSTGKGPTRDGRFKPNVMAPGASIRSCLTKTTSGYTDKSGTSMATPHVAGIAAGMMDHYSSMKRNPSLVKAVLAANTNSPTTLRSLSTTSNEYIYRQGLGQVDAYKSNWSYNTTKGWVTGHASGTFTYLTAGASFDVTVPADAKSTIFVLNFDEKAASPAATRACLADLDLHLDVEGFSAGYNTGEYSAIRSYDTWEWYGNVGSIASVRGKKIRVKIYPRVRPFFGTTVKWSVAYMFPRGPTSSLGTVNGSVTSTSLKSYLKPREITTIYANVNVPSWIQTNSWVEMYSTGGFSVLSMNHTSVDNLLRSYTSTTLPGVGDSLLNWTLGHIPNFASTAHRRLEWRITKTANGLGTVCFRLRSDNRPSSLPITTCRTLCVDGLLPYTVAGLTSATHPASVWRTSSAFTATWKTPSDLGCAGIGGLAYSLTSSSKTIPTKQNITGSATGKSLTVGSTAGLYFHVRAVDRAGNLSATTSHFGPIRVDQTKPTFTKAQINGTATYTRSLNVGLTISATDSYSGLYRMRYSSNGKNWSLWRTYTTATQSYNLSTYGGNTLQGTKRVYFQLQDRAGNLSSLASDTIIYDSVAPVISTVSINAGAAYTTSSVVGIQASGVGANYMQYSFNGSTWSPLYTYSTLVRKFSVGSYGGNTSQGTKVAYVRLRDLAGNYSTVKSDSIVYDSVSPLVTLVQINNGTTYTTSSTVGVKVLGSGSPTQVQYSFNGTTWSAWMSYTTSNRSLSLSSYGGSTAQGVKTVYARLRDAATNTSTTKSDTIIYDSVAPQVTLVRINTGAAYTTSTSVSVQVLGSGSPTQVQYSFNGSTWSSWMSYTTGNRSMSLASYGGNTAQGLKTVYARVRDAATNPSSTRTDTIIYDSVPPVLSTVVINSGAAYTKSLAVGVNVTGSGATHLQYSFNGSTWSGLMAYTTSTLPLSVNSYGGSTSQGTKTCYLRLRDMAGNYSAVKSDSIIYDSIGPLVTQVSINAGATYTNNSTVSVQVLGTGLPTRVQYSFNGSTWSPWMSYTTGSRTMSVASYGGNTTEGVKTVYARLLDAATNLSLTKTDTIIYDRTAPVVTLVQMNGGTTHTNSTSVNVQVLGTGSPTQVQYSFNGTTWSTWMSYTTGTRNLNVASYGGNSFEGIKTVYARLRDAAANLSSTRTDTIIYDKTAPVVTLVQINGGNAYTNALTVSTQVLGTGTPTQVQYSFNGSTWSAWMSYTSGTRNLSVTTFGGNANVGTKTLYSRIRDAAYNVSTTKTDTIIYMKVPSYTPTSGVNFSVIHDNKITLSGTGLSNIDRAYVGTTLITSTSPEDWHKGYFKVLSDTQLEIYPPQNLAPNVYSCYLRNAGYRGPNFTVKVDHNTTSMTGVPTVLKSGKVLHVYTHRGPKPATTVSVLTFSISPKPLVIPGLISLGHGGNTTFFIDPTFTIISPGQVHNATTRTAHWAFPTPAGKIAGNLYWQSVMFDAANPTMTPIPVSTTDVVKFSK